MADKYRFVDVARAERFYVATILGHVLMANGFMGLKLLFAQVFGSKTKTCPKVDDFEIVSELDPLRDASVYNTAVQKIYQKYRRIAVPDLFLRWGGLCLIIEAKFFTDPSAEKLGAQIALQKQAIARIKKFTSYSDIKFASLALDKTTGIKNTVSLSWEDIVKLMDKIPPAGLSEDLVYCRRVLSAAIARARGELKDLASGKITYTKYRFSDLISVLEKDTSGFVGFQGGSARLASTDRKQLGARSHYKFSLRSWSKDNWIPAEEFLQIVSQKTR
jgi:hypothetical protein